MHIPEFDYMRFAKTVPGGARIALTASGLPAPPVEWLGDPRALVDLTDAGGAGTRFLRERIAARHGGHPDHLLITPGASAALHLVAMALAAEPGDAGQRAIVERSVYPPLHLEPEMFGAQVRFADRRIEDGFRLDPARVASALSASGGAGSVWCTNLHNPSGVGVSAAELKEIGRTASSAGARVVCCEIYNEFLGARRAVPAARLVPGAVSVSSMTKAFGLGAARVGWIHCEDARFLALCERAFDHIDVNCAMPSMRIAAAALDAAPRFERRIDEIAGAGWSVFEAWAKREAAAGRVQWVKPDGGIIAFPRLVGVADTTAFAARVRARHGVQLTPGEFFGTPGFVRIGFGLDPAKLQEGLEALSSELPRG